MIRAQARELLESMTAWDDDPALSESEIEYLLDLYPLADSDGLAPDAATWTPTYDLNRAAAKGWLWKAGKVASRFTFSSDVSSFARDQLQKHCLEMVKQYSKGMATLEVGTGVLGWDPVIGNINGGT